MDTFVVSVTKCDLGMIGNFALIFWNFWFSSEEFAVCSIPASLSKEFIRFTSYTE